MRLTLFTFLAWLCAAAHTAEPDTIPLIGILKGTNASELSVEQVSKFKFAVNLKAAIALGLTLPESIHVRAEDVLR